MKYVYFVVYTYERGRYKFESNDIIKYDRPIQERADIRSIESSLEDDEMLNLSINNFILLRTEDE